MLECVSSEVNEPIINSIQKEDIEQVDIELVHTAHYKTIVVRGNKAVVTFLSTT